MVIGLIKIVELFIMYYKILIGMVTLSYGLIVVIFHMKEVIISEILIRVSKAGTILSKGS
jgi:hypothetical protein